jgi:ribosomal protein L11 methyltransferase
LSAVLDVSEDHKEAVCDLMWTRGAQGITEDHPGLHFSDDNALYVTDEWEVPEPKNPTGSVQLTAWFEAQESLNLLVRDLGVLWLRLGVVPPEVRIEGAPETDWNAAWKKGWEITPLTDRIFVVPEWLEPPELKEGQYVITLDPGMAFGTGTHETTIICAELLQQELAGRPGMRLLDVGTGTGILAIAGLLLGASSALGVDTDPAAVRVAQETAHKNGLADRFTARCGSADLTDERWPLVVGNLLAPLIITLADQLAARTSEDGLLIVSGLLVTQAKSVIAALEAEGMVLRSRLDRNEWSGLCFEWGAYS